MENNSYNSLTQKLIQNGFLLDEEEKEEENIFENHFLKPLSEEEQEENQEKENKTKKRINQYDQDLIKSDIMDNAIKKTINFKIAIIFKILNRKLLSKFFPKLYNAKATQEALLKLLEIDNNTKDLLNKTIPYGEGEGRYKDLIKYLSCANKIQKEIGNGK